MFDRIRRIASSANLRALTGNSVPIAYDETNDVLVYTDTGSTVRTLLTTDNAQTISGKIDGDLKVLAADFTAASGTTGTTLTSLTGLSWTVVAAGTYRFRFVIPAVSMSVNNGLKLAFKLTTATLTSVNLRVRSSTDTDNTGAVSVAFSTATDQATWVAQNAVVYTHIVVEGTLVVNAAGTIAVQAAQNASHADVLTITKGAYGQLVRAA